MVDLLVHRSISILLYLFTHSMRRVVVVDKIVPCCAFSITSREHDRSKSIRNVVMLLWNSEADVMPKTLTTICMSFILFRRNGPKFLFLFVRHGRYFEGSRLSIQVIIWPYIRNFLFMRTFLVGQESPFFRLALRQAYSPAAAFSSFWPRSRSFSQSTSTIRQRG